MKNVFLKKTLSFTMMLGIFAQTAGLFVTQRYATAAEANKNFPDASYIKTWNEVSSKWEAIKSGADLDRAARKLKVGFNPRFDEQDRKFWLSQMIQSSTLAHLKQNGDAYEFWTADKKQKLLSFKVSGDTYAFANGEFTYNDSESLEKNFSRLKSVIDSQKISFVDSLFIPKAEASIWWAIGGAALTFVLIRGFQTKWGNFKDAGNEVKKSGQHLKEGEVGDSLVHGLNAPGKLFLGGEEKKD